MDENKNLSALIERIDQANQKQTKFAKWQCFFSAIAAACCAAILIIVLCLLPQINAAIEQANIVMDDIRQVSSQLTQADWEGLVSDLEEVSEQLAQANLGSIAKDINALVDSCQTGVQDAVEKLDAIDLKTLNKAIKDLSDVVEPLARFFNRF